MKNKFIQLTLAGGLLLGTVGCSALGSSTGTASTLGNSVNALSVVQNTLNGGLSDALSIFGDKENFLNNALVQAAMPKELKNINSKLNNLGLSNIVDKEQDIIGQIAGSTISTTKPILEDAIKNITPQDAAGILTGGKGAATKYLKDQSYTKLVDALSPVVSSQMDQLGLNNVLGSALGGDNKVTSILGSVLGGKNKTSTSLTQGLNNSVTDQLVDGLFNIVEKSENSTRANPTGLLKSLLKGKS